MDDQEIPGNVGLLDVRKALSWIQKNIIAFGGDPQRVTLAGQDSGATLAMILKSVEIGDNLFSKLILHSGGIQHPWSFIPTREAFKRALSLAALVGCPTSGSSKQVSKSNKVLTLDLRLSSLFLSRSHSKKKFINMKDITRKIYKLNRNLILKSRTIHMWVNRLY